MKLPYREKVIACERGGTYKYFLGADRVTAVWDALAHTYGAIEKRACTEADVTALHAVLELVEVVDA